MADFGSRSHCLGHAGQQYCRQSAQVRRPKLLFQVTENAEFIPGVMTGNHNSRRQSHSGTTDTVCRRCHTGMVASCLTFPLTPRPPAGVDILAQTGTTANSCIPGSKPATAQAQVNCARGAS